MGFAVFAILTMFPEPAHEGLDLQIARATKEIEARPDDAELYLQRGELHRLHEDWAAAKADYDRAEKLDPKMAGVDLARGRLWLSAGDAKEAKKCLDRFLAREPGSAPGLIERGRSLVRLGRRLEGVEDYTRALAGADRHKPEWYLERAEALRAEGPTRLEEAVRGLDEGIRKLGPVVSLRLLAIDLDLESKRYDAALSRVEEIARQAERKDPWLVRRGEILRQAGRNPDAREAFLAALASIEALPPSRRAAKYTQELETKARAALEVIDGKP